MVRPNHRKSQILAFVLDCGEAGCTSSDIVDVLGITIFNASCLLRHYHRNGLVRRSRAKQGNSYIYWPSKKTETELRYWLNRPVTGRLLLEEHVEEEGLIISRLID